MLFPSALGSGPIGLLPVVRPGDGPIKVERVNALERGRVLGVVVVVDLIGPGGGRGREGRGEGESRGLGELHGGRQEGTARERDASS